MRISVRGIHDYDNKGTKKCYEKYLDRLVKQFECSKNKWFHFRDLVFKCSIEAVPIRINLKHIFPMCIHSISIGTFGSHICVSRILLNSLHM